MGEGAPVKTAPCERSPVEGIDLDLDRVHLDLDRVYLGLESGCRGLASLHIGLQPLHATANLGILGLDVAKYAQNRLNLA